MKEKIRRIVMESLEEMNQIRDEPLDISEDIKFVGSEGQFDSMDLVNLIVNVEERLYDELGLSLVIASERAFSRKRSPFYNMQSLSSYIAELVEETA